ncbi:uncharacterized protein LOC101859426 [Aplysia californica]|uniref:Uncharacterized protein LOC101859426 n=1 Tax=Aplysia californica TaxID=6500 RepID=A0ABM0JXT0_APLCA|nr:uncharacterized protein LOC101859426 [Aplysia californica]XP_005104041.1 uncharacterized protein LOC101859426 [Aplysia californica]
MGDSEVPQKKLEVRVATVDDYESVLDINRNVYGGADYIVTDYHDLVIDPDFRYYVCTVDGEVGGFEGVCILDDGDTLMTRSARVKDKFQGLGILRLIRKQIYQDFQSKPGKKRIRTCCTNLVRLVHSERFRKANRTLAVRNIFTVDSMHEMPAGALSPTEDAAIVSEVTLTHFSDLLDDKQLMNFLFPEGFFTCISWFYDTRRSNVRHLAKISPYIVASNKLLEFSKRRTKPERQQGEMDNNTGSKNDAQDEEIDSGLIGIMAGYGSPAMFLVSIDISGQPTAGEEKKEIEQMIRAFIRQIKVQYDQGGFDPKIPFAFGAFLQDRIDSKPFEEVLTDLGFTRDHEFSKQFKGSYMFEQSFEQLLD